jgi:hypothetical protein
MSSTIPTLSLQSYIIDSAEESASELLNYRDLHDFCIFTRRCPIHRPEVNAERASWLYTVDTLYTGHKERRLRFEIEPLTQNHYILSYMNYTAYVFVVILHVVTLKCYTTKSTKLKIANDRKFLEFGRNQDSTSLHRRCTPYAFNSKETTVCITLYL